MSGSFYALWVKPRQRTLVFSMGLPLRIAFGVFWVSVTVALAPALFAGSGISVEPDGWVPASVVWLLLTLGLGWRDRWVFDARGRFHRDRGWWLLSHRKTRPLKGFGGWVVETYPSRRLDPSGRRGALEFRTDEGRWRIDARFRAEWLERQRPVLALWSQWLTEGKAS